MSLALSSQSWVPILAIVVALLAPTIATVVGVTLASHNAARAATAASATNVATKENSRKLDVIHGLVNSRLEEAKAKITELEQRLFEITGEPLPSWSPDSPAPDVSP